MPRFASAPPRAWRPETCYVNTTWSSDAVYTAACVFPHGYLYDNEKPDSGSATVDERAARIGRPLAIITDRNLLRQYKYGRETIEGPGHRRHARA
jgi:hypothetical protein